MNIAFKPNIPDKYRLPEKEQAVKLFKREDKIIWKHPSNVLILSNMVAKGLTIAEIAVKVKAPYGSVRYALKKTKRINYVNKGRKDWSDKEHELLIQLKANGASHAECAEVFGVDSSQIARKLYKNKPLHDQIKTLRKENLSKIVEQYK